MEDVRDVDWYPDPVAMLRHVCCGVRGLEACSHLYLELPIDVCDDYSSGIWGPRECSMIVGSIGRVKQRFLSVFKHPHSLSFSKTLAGMFQIIEVKMR